MARYLLHMKSISYVLFIPLLIFYFLVDAPPTWMVLCSRFDDPERSFNLGVFLVACSGLTMGHDDMATCASDLLS